MAIQDDDITRMRRRRALDAPSESLSPADLLRAAADDIEGADIRKLVTIAVEELPSGNYKHHVYAAGIVSTYEAVGLLTAEVFRDLSANWEGE